MKFYLRYDEEHLKSCECPYCKMKLEGVEYSRDYSKEVDPERLITPNGQPVGLPQIDFSGMSEEQIQAVWKPFRENSERRERRIVHLKKCKCQYCSITTTF